jgi:hypothetical protein
LGLHGVYHAAQKPPLGRSRFTFAHYDTSQGFDEKTRRSMSARLSIIALMKRIAETRQMKLQPLKNDLSLDETGFDGDFVRVYENVRA